MIVLANIVIAVVAILHLGFLALEMFFWNHPFGQKRFGMTPEYSQASASLAANQGLYNGFLAAGLIWELDYRRVLYKSIFPDLCHHCRNFWRLYSATIHPLHTGLAGLTGLDIALSLQVDLFYE